MLSLAARFSAVGCPLEAFSLDAALDADTAKTLRIGTSTMMRYFPDVPCRISIAMQHLNLPAILFFEPSIE